REGDKAVLFYWSANRDETVFADPGRLDLTRSPNPHVGFGAAGPHFCLGAHLARREVGVMLRELLTRIPDIRATAPPDRLLSSFITGVKHLPCPFGGCPAGPASPGPGHDPGRRQRVGAPPCSASRCPASAMSAAVRPPAEWVDRVSVTLFHSIRMSG